MIFSFSNPILSDAEDTLNPLLNKLIKTSNELKGPDQAFKFEAIFNELDQIELTWSIDNQCFLYKEKLEFYISPKQNFSSKTNNTAVLQDDEYFGNVEVYYQELKYFLTGDFSEEAIIDIVYQGCNEKGFCYPPIKKQILFVKSKRYISFN
jgi:thiol:disulfide interchange protein DsbD